MRDRATDLSFWDVVCLDAAAAGDRIDLRAPFLSRVWRIRRLIRSRPGFACTFWLRVNQLFIRRGWRGQFRLRIWRQYRFSNDISPYAEIGPGFSLPHITDITIGSTVVICHNVTIYNGVTLGSKHAGGDAGMPHIGSNVIIYSGAKLIGAVQIGDNSEIGALSLCNKDVPPNSVMYGIPPNTTIRPKNTTL